MQRDTTGQRERGGAVETAHGHSGSSRSPAGGGGSADPPAIRHGPGVWPILMIAGALAVAGVLLGAMVSISRREGE